MSLGAHLHTLLPAPGASSLVCAMREAGMGRGRYAWVARVAGRSVVQAQKGPGRGGPGGAICLPSPLLWCLFQEVHRIVNQALKRYSEDRIGMVDYALESGGVCAALLLQPSPGPRAGLWQLPEQLCARQAGLVRSPPTRTHHKGP